MNSEMKKFDVAAKKEILGLLLKKIIINNQRNARTRSRVSPVFYEPFQKITAKNQLCIEKRRKMRRYYIKTYDGLIITPGNKKAPLLRTGPLLLIYGRFFRTG